jgi:transposase
VGFEESECCCSTCGKPIIELASVDESEQLEIEVRSYRRRIRKKKYKKTCQCPGISSIITAPGPDKLIPKGKYGISVWETLIIEKYLYQRPTNRTLASLSTHGIHIPPGTVGDGFKRLAPLFTPVEQAIHEKSVSENWWHADETRWMVFELFENKQNYKWFLWVFVSKSAVVNVIAPSRATTVIEDFFGAVKTGILCVDRYVAYKCFVKTRKGFILAFCWAHVRRDFLDVGNSWPKLEEWALGWVNSIGMTFHLNNLRVQHMEKTKDFEDANVNLKKALAEMEKQYDKELASKQLAHVCRKTLESLKNHWKGLNVFVEHPHIPMDNSEAERKIRPGTVGRKNYYGSGSIGSAYFTAAMFSIFQTLLLWNINPRIWLSRYLHTCAENGGEPPQDISEFLPWKMTEEQKRAMDMNWQSSDTS